jgi:heat shock protein HslJ
MKKTSVQILTIITLAFAASASAQTSPAGRTWKLEFLRGVNTRSVDVHIQFDTVGKRFTGNTGCNVMNGAVRIKANSIAFSRVITTKRACAGAARAVETGLLAALGRTTRFQSSRNRLRLYARNRLLAEFSSITDPSEIDEPQNVADTFRLEERKWVLESISGKTIPKVEQAAFIVFDPVKGSAGGDTSCNVFGGSYSTQGNKIKFTQTISTMRACIEDQRMDIERGFLDGLRAADRYEIRADRLLLYERNRLVLSFVGRKK